MRSTHSGRSTTLAASCIMRGTRFPGWYDAGHHCYHLYPLSYCNDLLCVPLFFPGKQTPYKTSGEFNSLLFHTSPSCLCLVRVCCPVALQCTFIYLYLFILPPWLLSCSGSWRQAKVNKGLAVQALFNNLGWSGIQGQAPLSRLAPAKGPIQSVLFAHACHSWAHHHGN